MSEVDNRPWLATAIQMGTNDRMSVTGDTKEEVMTKLYGQAYGPQWGSVKFYRLPETERGKK